MPRLIQCSTSSYFTAKPQTVRDERSSDLPQCSARVKLSEGAEIATFYTDDGRAYSPNFPPLIKYVHPLFHVFLNIVNHARPDFPQSPEAFCDRLQDLQDDHHERERELSRSRSSTRPRSRSLDAYKPDMLIAKMSKADRKALTNDLRETGRQHAIDRGRAKYGGVDYNPTDEEIMDEYRVIMQTRHYYHGNTGVMSKNKIEMFRYHLRMDKSWVVPKQRLWDLILKQHQLVSFGLIDVVATHSTWGNDDAQDKNKVDLPKRKVKEVREPKGPLSDEEKTARRIAEQHERYVLFNRAQPPPRERPFDAREVYPLQTERRHHDQGRSAYRP